MTTIDPLDTLIDLSRRARDNAGRLLAEEQRGVQATTSQLETLQQYRDEYCRRLQQAMEEGISAAVLDDYNRFIRSLDSAITRARTVLAQQQERVAASRQHWQEQQRQLSSYTTLAERRAERERRQALRRERLQTDEITLNILARRRPGESSSFM